MTSRIVQRRANSRPIDSLQPSKYRKSIAGSLQKNESIYPTEADPIQTLETILPIITPKKPLYRKHVYKEQEFVQVLLPSGNSQILSPQIKKISFFLGDFNEVKQIGNVLINAQETLTYNWKYVPAKKTFCNCSRSGCIKKYCECFAKGIPCSSLCRCQHCKNPPTSGSQPGESLHTDHYCLGDSLAHNYVLNLKDYDKIPRFNQDFELEVSYCRCSKGGQCLNRYCSCKKGGMRCGQACKCINCKN